MSVENFTLEASARDVSGKGASRRLRREQGLVPAIVYGGDKAPVNVSVMHKELVKHLENEAFYSHIITLNIGGQAESVILKDLQRHPAKAFVLHADFLRVSASTKITVSVPLHFINEAACVGVKMGGGLINHLLTQLEISCLPSALPEYIEVDMAEMDVGQTLHISDLKLPAGVTSVALAHGTEHDLPVVAVNKAKGGDDTAA
jgi:large subunit ribosomal protein L25